MIGRRKSLAGDSTLPLQPPCSTEFSLAHNVDSKTEVDTVIGQAVQAGAKLVKPARVTSYGGYAGYLLDPHGHLWEVAFNPELASL
ncbi:MAG TPA: VOC family protein [Ideonella sp.]|nr:VOC family protein [Ideonella sp.]